VGVNRFILHPDQTREAVKRNLDAHLQTLDTKHAYLVEIKRWSKRRSDRQNRYLWGLVYPTFTDALDGWDSEDVHEYLLGEHFGWETLEGFGRRRMRPIRRSSRLNKLEFAEYVDFCIRKAAEHGLIVPEPDWGYRMEASR
jgi:hypothetical protein